LIHKIPASREAGLFFPVKMESQKKKQGKNCETHNRHGYISELQKISLGARNRSSKHVA
jgi:hypothetical protein